MDHIIKINKLCMNFGGVRAVDNINAYVDKGEIFGIIGPNGSGKTTLINVIAGVYKPTSGDVIFNGNNITGMKTHKIASLGIKRTFQNLRLFRSMTVLENVIVGEHSRIQTNLYQAIVGSRSYKESERRIKERALEAIKMVGLEKMTNEIAGGMAYGQQKRLELARALVGDPLLWLLDEPAAGMNFSEAMEIMEIIRYIKEKKNIAIILIEHNMQAMMNTADRIMVMDAGKKIAEDVPDVVKNDQKVIGVYLGEDEQC